MRRRSVAIVLVLLGMSAAPSFGETPALLEVTTPSGSIRGKEIARTADETCLMGPDGRIHVIENRVVKARKTVSPRFRPWSHSTLRTAISRELGSGFSSSATQRYVVFARDSKTAEKYVKLFDDTYRLVYQYFSVRGISLTAPEFPLVAIVFPDHGSFAKYAANDKVKATRTLMGYYHALSNRVALFEGASTGGETASDSDVDGDSAWTNAGGQVKDTIIHEATHQVAFNTGLHSRLGSNPKWAVEGLATVFETGAARNTSASVGKRINIERFVWFGNYAKERRESKSIATFLSSDKSFERNALDAYSEAWAFSFYLIETRPRQYVQYLKKVAERDPLRVYSPADRLADFQSVFGKETALLEAQFLRYISGLK